MDITITKYLFYMTLLRNNKIMITKKTIGKKKKLT